MVEYFEQSKVILKILIPLIVIQCILKTVNVRTGTYATMIIHGRCHEKCHLIISNAFETSAAKVVTADIPHFFCA